MITIAGALQLAIQQLTYFDTPTLDAEIMLAHTLNVSRAHLLAFPEKKLTQVEESAFLALLEKRKQGTPIAYLTGHKEFWSLDLIVTPDTLIPRPDTELLVEVALQSLSEDKKTIADLGTGSGAVALALAKERPHWQVYATDVSAKALNIAKQNAARLNLNQIIFKETRWCQDLPKQFFDAIVSNPPYIAEDDPHLANNELTFEPLSALVSGSEGLNDIEVIATEARECLKPGGYLILEHGYQQSEEVKNIFLKMGYTHINLFLDLAGRGRVTKATY